MGTQGRPPQSVARGGCYVCGSRDGERVFDHVPGSWVYPSREVPEPWPVAPVCRRCHDLREPADLALRSFVTTTIASCRGGSDRWRDWIESPPRAVRDGVDTLVRALHCVLYGECAPEATTIVSADPPPGHGLAGAVDVFDVGPDFRVEHVRTRLSDRWRITYFDLVSFHVVTCPPLSDALRSMSA
jgi:hypothetical protein